MKLYSKYCNSLESFTLRFTTARAGAQIRIVMAWPQMGSFQVKGKRDSILRKDLRKDFENSKKNNEIPIIDDFQFSECTWFTFLFSVGSAGRADPFFESRNRVCKGRRCCMFSWRSSQALRKALHRFWRFFAMSFLINFLYLAIETPIRFTRGTALDGFDSISP